MKSKYFELKETTVQRIMAMAMAILAVLIAAGKVIKVHISKGNSKIGKCLNVSTMPVMTCGHCEACKYGCYAMKVLAFRGIKVLTAWIENTYMMRYHIAEYFQQIDDAMSRRRLHKYLRFHVAGEFQRIEELDGMRQLAIAHPDFQIWTYTKMHIMVNSWVKKLGGKDAIPSNLHIMYSQWGNVKVQNPYGFPVFKTVTDGIHSNCWQCPGNCDLCKAEFSHDGKSHGCILGEDTEVEKHN